MAPLARRACHSSHPPLHKPRSQPQLPPCHTQVNTPTTAAESLPGEALQPPPSARRRSFLQDPDLENSQEPDAQEVSELIACLDRATENATTGRDVAAVAAAAARISSTAALARLVVLTKDVCKDSTPPGAGAGMDAAEPSLVPDSQEAAELVAVTLAAEASARKARCPATPPPPPSRCGAPIDEVLPSDEVLSSSLSDEVLSSDSDEDAEMAALFAAERAGTLEQTAAALSAAKAAAAAAEPSAGAQAGQNTAAFGASSPGKRPPPAGHAGGGPSKRSGCAAGLRTVARDLFPYPAV